MPPSVPDTDHRKATLKSPHAERSAPAVCEFDLVNPEYGIRIHDAQARGRNRANAARPLVRPLYVALVSCYPICYLCAIVIQTRDANGARTPTIV
jgi:hypothetical protein